MKNLFVTHPSIPYYTGSREKQSVLLAPGEPIFKRYLLIWRLSQGDL